MLSGDSCWFSPVLFSFWWLISEVWFSVLLEQLWGPTEPGLGSRPAPLICSSRRLVLEAPTSPFPPHPAPPAHLIRGRVGGGMNKTSLPKNNSRKNKEHGPWGSGSLGFHGKTGPPRELGGGQRGLQLRGPWGRWGRWEEIVLAGPLHRQERKVASGWDTEEEMQPGW